MKKLIAVLLILSGCQNKQLHEQNRVEPVYVFDSLGLLDSSYISDDLIDDPTDKPIMLIRYKTSKYMPKYADTFLISNNRKIYMLEHYIDYNNYSDTFFVKHKSHLNSIRYYDSEWLKNEEKLDSFWLPLNYWSNGGVDDTLEIYLILPIVDSDSLKFLQVHRWFHQTQ